MTDYLNPDKLYPDDISRRIDTPPGFDTARQVSANLSEKLPQNSPKCGADYRQQLDDGSTKQSGEGVIDREVTKSDDTEVFEAEVKNSQKTEVFELEVKKEGEG